MMESECERERGRYGRGGLAQQQQRAVSKQTEKLKTIKEMAAVWRGVNGNLNTTDRRGRQTNSKRGGGNYMVKMGNANWS